MKKRHLDKGEMGITPEEDGSRMPPEMLPKFLKMVAKKFKSGKPLTSADVDAFIKKAR